MHKGVILLTEAENKEDALEKVSEFMEQYQDDVWDWYSVGGRWSNTLAPKYEEFEKWAHDFLLSEQKKDEKFKNWTDDMIAQDTVEKHQNTLQAKWEEIEMKGENPHFNHYSLGNNGSYYDAILLKDCLDKVRSWIRDIDKESDEIFQKLIDTHTKEKESGGGTLSGYYAGLYRNAIYKSFCFDSNVYNITTDEAEKIPENIDKYWAVIVDMHN